MSDFVQGTVAAEIEFNIEISSRAGDLVGGDIQAAEFYADFCGAASGDALKIHLCDGGFERAVPAGTGSEWCGATADLRETEIEFTDGSLERARLKTVGVSGASLGPLLGGRR